MMHQALLWVQSLTQLLGCEGTGPQSLTQTCNPRGKLAEAQERKFFWKGHITSFHSQ